ncbi:DUF4337 family protein [Blastococcus sp. TML/M2B]|uniref:DUF4337 family protein n=1 Tax=unclassified Blastococcus TaxID=2619396 RepID=UPI00190D7911|nr:MULTISPECIES: DUF4337 family protein [unclassified Blastococcus]MBN1091919.1 DUF4337 family protein [Blastococcus sp. TML/M2B]MBN1097977.1 DUF4337 family protein [Blastococcus sp. TML/C7B]
MSTEFAAPATPADPDARDGGRRTEILAAFLLGLAAVATAWSAYWSAIYGGNAIQGYAQSNTLTSQAADVYGDATGQYNFDRTLFLQYAELRITGQEEAADVLRESFFSDSLAETVDWYDTTGDEVTDPFDADAGSPYSLAEWAQGNALSEEADAAYQEAVAADDKGDRFDLATVFLALSLFFGGIATVFRRYLPQVATLAIGGAGLLIGGGAVLWAHLG